MLGIGRKDALEKIATFPPDTQPTRFYAKMDLPGLELKVISDNFSGFFGFNFQIGA
jgi:hypothetical protein